MRRLIGVCAFLLGLVLTPALARADTVHLKNGRVLRAAKVTVQDDKVILEQSGNRVEFPMSLVEKIDRDAAVSEVLEPGERPTAPETAEGDEGEGEGAGEGESAEGEPQDPKQTREYWQEAMQQIRDARSELQTEVERLKREERAFLFSHRSTAETRRKIEQAEEQLEALQTQMDDLRREARRAQVPPGWLR